MSFSDVPKEIQALILSRLDGCSLVRAQRTCKLWYESIHTLERIFHIWLLCCLKEIDNDILIDITGFVELAFLQHKDAVLSQLGELPWHFWRARYAEFHRAEYINFAGETTIELCFFMGYGMVTCLHMKDKLLISGHESGNVISWKNIDADVEASTIHRHQRLVTDITVLDTATTVYDVQSGKSNPVVATTSRDCSLRLNSLGMSVSAMVNCYSKEINTVCSWGNSLIAAADGSMLQGQPVWQVTADTSGLCIDTKCRLSGQKTSNMKAVAVWDNKVMTGDELGNLFYKNLGGPTGLALKSGELVLEFVTNLGSPIKTLILKGQKILCFTGNRDIYTSIDGHEFVKHDMFEALQKSAECVCMWGSILAVGCKAGSVFMYQLQSTKDWQELNLAQPNQSFHTGREHVNSLAIGDDGAGPVLAIATEDPIIHIVRWRRAR